MNDADAWNDFWTVNAGAARGGCLPQRWAAIEEAQRATWDGFTAALREGTAILDLATGDGRVLGWMHAGRPDLELTGIDRAPNLPTAPDGTVTQGGIAMEDLPFDADTFGAVVSQFGFEYGDVAKVCAEISRVLAPGGTVALMIHRGDGPILEHNLARREAIEWVLSDQKLAQLLSTVLDAPNGGPQVAAQVAAAIGLLGAQRFGESSPGWEIPEALRRAVLMGEQAGTAAIRDAIAAIEHHANNEIGRIASLERACACADQRGAIVDQFTAAGLQQRSEAQVCEPSGRSLASFLVFS